MSFLWATGWVVIIVVCSWMAIKVYGANKNAV